VGRGDGGEGIDDKPEKTTGDTGVPTDRAKGVS